ncbi:hypothetical protein BHYA_0009g00030 [Botrytis hyacinthi]|uniref:Uncharacterized protein n=1 Tax=Botrytis hyacinthi TaxID=278943 RepID=A0A4Z1GZC4_9HELO|nr:hypothetical protein BHYA_0009g00030 [Botrytis hyacinthi]
MTIALTADPNDPRRLPKAKILDCVDLQALRTFRKEREADTMPSFTRLLLKKNQERVATVAFQTEERDKKLYQARPCANGPTMIT